MSLRRMDGEGRASRVVAIDTKADPGHKKILEEEEYLGRMAWIIKRDFIGSDSESPYFDNGSSSFHSSDTACRETQRTDRTDSSATSSVRSMQNLRSMRLDEYLNKYNSEDNAYFDKLQRKELKRHRVKYPWLYSKKKVADGRQIGSGTERLSIEGPSSAIGESSSLEFKKNTLFYSPAQSTSSNQRATINYDSNKSFTFKEPLPLRIDRPKVINRFTDKIGVDGRLLSGDETPSIGGFSFVPPPDTPKLNDFNEKTVMDKNRYYIPSESPKDNLANRIYDQKVANKIRTPSLSTRSDSKRNPKSVFDKIF